MLRIKDLDRLAQEIMTVQEQNKRDPKTFIIEDDVLHAIHAYQNEECLEDDQLIGTEVIISPAGGLFPPEIRWQSGLTVTVVKMIAEPDGWNVLAVYRGVAGWDTSIWVTEPGKRQKHCDWPLINHLGPHPDPNHRFY